MHNPRDNPLFLLGAVRIERQERDNQMTTGVIQTELISDFRFFTSGQIGRILLATAAMELSTLRRKSGLYILISR